MQVPADLHDVAATRLRHADQRYTSNRRRLIEVLAHAERPLAIPEILTRETRLVQSSAYRNLAILESVGVVHRVVTSDDFARFELTEELTDDHHHHLICSQCGSVQDVSLSARFEKELEREVAAVARRARLAIERHQLDVMGTCVDCRADS